MNEVAKIQYQNLKCILEHFDVMKRLDLVAHVPTLQKIDKSIPLTFDYLEIHDVQFFIQVNNIEMEFEKIGEDGYIIVTNNGLSYPHIFPKTPFPTRSDGMSFLKRLFFSERHLKVKKFNLNASFSDRNLNFTIDIDRLKTDSQSASSLQRHLKSPLKLLELFLIDSEDLEMDIVTQAKTLVVNEFCREEIRFPPLCLNPVVVFQDLYCTESRLSFFIQCWSGQAMTDGMLFMRTKGRRQSTKVVDQMSKRFHTKFVDLDMTQRKSIILTTKILCIPLTYVTQVVVHGFEQTIQNKPDQSFLCHYVKIEIMPNNADIAERLDKRFNFFSVS